MADPPNPYPFPSSFNILHSVTLKLNYTNYLLWKIQFESLLASQKLLGFVNGAVTAPASVITVVVNEIETQTPNPLYESWFCSDQLVKSWLFGTLSEEVLATFITSPRRVRYGFVLLKTSTKAPLLESLVSDGTFNSSPTKART